MATERTLPDEGTMVSWSPPKSTRFQAVVDGFKLLGLQEHVPDKRTPMACLKAAIADVFDVKEIVDDPKLETRVIESQPKGFVVGVKRPKVHKAPGQSLGTTKISITLDDKGEIDMDPWDSEKIRLLKEGMAGAALWLPSGPCVKALREIITTWGLSMDSMGAWYWLPGDLMSLWKQLEQVMVDASAKGDKDGEDALPWGFGHMPCKRDPDWLATVLKRLVAELDAKVSGIEYELANGGLGVRAIDNREASSQHLLEKIAKIEHILGEPLKHLKDEVLTRIQSAAAMAKLAAIVKAEQEQGVAT